MLPSRKMNQNPTSIANSAQLHSHQLLTTPPQKQVLVVTHQKHSSSGAIGHVLREQGYHLDVRCPALGDHLPPNLEHHEAVVVFGGFMSANDDDKLDFIRQELNWIPTVLETKKPFLGVCLGAQMLAKVLGGRVTPHAEGMTEIGYFPIEPIFNPTIPEGQHFHAPRHVYHWHQEGIELPRTALKLATGDTFSTQAFSYSGHAYGVQFHPEMTTELMKKWLTLGVEMLTRPGAQSPEEQIKNHALYGDDCLHWLQAFIPFWLEGSFAPVR